MYFFLHECWNFFCVKQRFLSRPQEIRDLFLLWENLLSFGDADRFWSVFKVQLCQALCCSAECSSSTCAGGYWRIVSCSDWVLFSLFSLFPMCYYEADLCGSSFAHSYSLRFCIFPHLKKKKQTTIQVVGWRGEEDGVYVLYMNLCMRYFLKYV